MRKVLIEHDEYEKCLKWPNRVWNWRAITTSYPFNLAAPGNFPSCFVDAGTSLFGACRDFAGDINKAGKFV